MEKFEMTTDCNKRGNATEIRESLLMGIKSVIDKCMDILNKIPDGCEYDGLIDDVADELCDFRESHVNKALFVPQRNCDKFKTPEEAYEGFVKFCDKSSCSKCRFSRNSSTCLLSWLYEESRKEGA